MSKEDEHLMTITFMSNSLHSASQKINELSEELRKTHELLMKAHVLASELNDKYAALVTAMNVGGQR